MIKILVKLIKFRHLTYTFSQMLSATLLNDLPIEVITTKILKRIFPFDLAFFLTSSYFYGLLDQYYEQFGIIGVQSKNFISALTAITSKSTSISEKLVFKKLSFEKLFTNLHYAQCSVIIPFTDNITTTTKMNHYLNLFTGIVVGKTALHYDEVKTQIIILMAHSTIERRYGIRPKSVNACIPSTNLHYYEVEEEFLNLRHNLVKQLLNHCTINTLKLNVPTIKYSHNKRNIRYICETNGPYTGLKLCCYEHVIETLEASVNIVNVFYAMIGVKRGYNTSYGKIIRRNCAGCGIDMNLMPNRNSDCKHDHGCITEHIYSFYATPIENAEYAALIKDAEYATLIQDADSKEMTYFECPNLYNDMYSKIKCIKLE